MADNVAITAGAGTSIASDGSSGVHYQRVKLAGGTEGDSTPITQTGGAMDVNLKTSAATLTVNNPTAANLKVDASGATVPISAASAIPVSDGGGSLSVDGTVTVNGTVTDNQGTPAVIANAWPVKLTDGADTANVTGTSLDVNVTSDVTNATQTDKSAFTEGTGKACVAAGVVNDTITSNPGEDQAAALRLTAFRGLHANLRNVSGVEIGTAGAPVRVDPTGSTTQPVSGTVGTNATQIAGNSISSPKTGVQLVGVADSSGNNITQQNPLQVQVAPSGGTGGASQTIWRNHVAYTASQTSQAIHTPAAGKTAYVEGLVIAPLTTGTVFVYDQSNAAANVVGFMGTPPTGGIIIHPARPIPLSAINDILRYDTGTGATGDITAWGYDA